MRAGADMRLFEGLVPKKHREWARLHAEIRRFGDMRLAVADIRQLAMPPALHSGAPLAFDAARAETGLWPWRSSRETASDYSEHSCHNDEDYEQVRNRQAAFAVPAADLFLHLDHSEALYAAGFDDDGTSEPEEFLERRRAALNEGRWAAAAQQPNSEGEHVPRHPRRARGMASCRATCHSSRVPS